MAARAGSRRVFAFLAGVMLMASTASSAVGQSPDASRFTATPIEPTATTRVTARGRSGPGP